VTAKSEICVQGAVVYNSQHVKSQTLGVILNITIEETCNRHKDSCQSIAETNACVNSGNCIIEPELNKIKCTVKVYDHASLYYCSYMVLITWWSVVLMCLNTIHCIFFQDPEMFEWMSFVDSLQLRCCITTDVFCPHLLHLFTLRIWSSYVFKGLTDTVSVISQQHYIRLITTQ